MTLARLDETRAPDRVLTFKLLMNRWLVGLNTITLSLVYQSQHVQ